jgi:hypothetical protein
VWIVLRAVEDEALRADGEGDAGLPLRIPPHPHQADRLLRAPGAARLLLYQQLTVERKSGSAFRNPADPAFLKL